MTEDISETVFSIDISWSRLPDGQERQAIKYNLSAHDGFNAGVSERGLHHISVDLEKIRAALEE